MQISMKIFLVVLLIIGFALTVCSFILAKPVDSCSNHAKNALRGLLTMGVLMFSISATMLACKCDANFDAAGSTLNTVFPVFILAIGITTIGLASTIHKECIDARKLTPILITLSVFITLGAGGYLGLKIYKKFNPTFVAGPVNSDGSPINSPTSSYGSDRSGSSNNSPTSLYGG